MGHTKITQMRRHNSLPVNGMHQQCQPPNLMIAKFPPPVQSTCCQHCSLPNHQCQCCHPNLSVAPEPRRITLHYIKADCSQTILATIFYDIERDAIYFQNSKGEERLMTPLVHSHHSHHNSLRQNHSNFNPTHRGPWKELESYVLHNLVYYDTSLYIALRPSRGVRPPSSPSDWLLWFDLKELFKDGKHTSSFDPDSKNDITSINILKNITAESVLQLPTPRHSFFENNELAKEDADQLPDLFALQPITETLWLPKTYYLEHNCVNLDGQCYISLCKHTSSLSNRPAIAPSFWQKIETTTPFPKQLYLLVVNHKEILEVNSKTGCSRRKPILSCDFDAAPPNTALTFTLETLTNSDSIQSSIIPFHYVEQINRNLFEVNHSTGDIKILQTGWYEMTYCMAYMGTVRIVSFSTWIGQGYPNQEILASHSSDYEVREHTLRQCTKTFPVYLETGMHVQIKMQMATHSCATSETHEKTVELKIFPMQSWFQLKATV
jgi:hypothetical protein